MTTSFLGVFLFGLTYVLISARRLGWLSLDRPAAALLGAAACVAFGVLSPLEALEAIDKNTLLLLFGMMGMGAFLWADGFFGRAAYRLAHHAETPQRLLGIIVWGSGLLSALITNDAVCVLGAALVVEVIRAHKLPPLPYLLALATAANSGSVATLVGNPQNMLCGNLGQLTYRGHLFLVGPIALMALGVNHLILLRLFRKELRAATFQEAPQREEPAVMTPGTWVIGAVIACTALAYTCGANLAWTAAAGLAVLFVLRRDLKASLVWAGIDWSVLVFFAGLFVVVEGLVKTGVPAWFFEKAALHTVEGFLDWLGLSAVFLFGSNVVSNVPFILVVREQMGAFSNPRMAWELLAVASTFAGNLTLIGSVANIIVAEKSHEVGGLGFWPYFRVGFPLALITTFLGTLWLYWMG